MVFNTGTTGVLEMNSKGTGLWKGGVLGVAGQRL